MHACGSTSNMLLVMLFNAQDNRTEFAGHVTVTVLPCTVFVMNVTFNFDACVCAGNDVNKKKGQEKNGEKLACNAAIFVLAA